MEIYEKIKSFVLNNIVSFIAITIAILAIAGSYIYVKGKECEICEPCIINTIENTTVEEPNEEQKIITKKIRIDVKGAVKKPGVYEMEEGSIVDDAIKSAGGTTSSGVTSNINLSKKLKDEMVIYIFTKKELSDEKSDNKVVCEVPKCTCEQVVVNKDIDTSRENDPNEQVTNSKISINTDSIAELMKLSGIGEAKAKAIIEYRKTNGNFIAIEDIKKVSGISENIFEKIKDYITV